MWEKLANTLHCLTYLLGKYFSLELWKEALQLSSVLAAVGGERLNLRCYRRNHWRSSIPTSLPEQGQLKAASQEGLCSDYCWILPGMEIPQPLWAICACAWSPSQGKCFILPWKQLLQISPSISELLNYFNLFNCKHSKGNHHFI